MEDWPPDDDVFDFDTGERDRPPRPPEGDPYDTGGYARRRRRDRGIEESGLEPVETGESASEPTPPPSEPPSESAEITPPRYRPGEPYEDPFVDTGEARRRAVERGDPFDTGEYRARRAGPRRHRDLPANVRRRQVFGLIGLVLLLVLGIYLLFFSGGGGGDEEESLPVKKLVGQTIVGTLGDGGVDKALLKRVQKGQLGGIIITAENPLDSEVERDTAKLQKAARLGDNPPLLIMVDQEGGFVKRLPGPPDLGPEEIADEGPESAQEEGTKTGEYLAGLGVNVDLAPVIDVGHDNTEETIVSRVYGEDPAEVGELGSAFITGLQSAGVAATAKHFPGLGLATTNTDFDRVSIASTKDELQADIEPFRQAVAAGVDMVMVATAVYPDLSGNKSAAFSANVIQNELRTKLDFQGVVVTDDLEAPGSTASGPAAGAVQTLDAGGDLVLTAQSAGASAKAFEAVVKAIKSGRLEQSVVEAAYDRIQALKKKLG
jgi:beta-N-acetylhexosaminidase